jgi:PAS domain S-box-containing protein
MAFAGYDQDVMFRSLADIAPVMMWACDTKGNTVFFNKAWLDFTGHTLETELATIWSERMHPDDYEYCTQIFYDTLQNPCEFKVEYRLKSRHDFYHWMSDHVVPRTDLQGNFIGFAGFCTDVTGQKLVQEAEQEQRVYAETLANVTLALTSHITLNEVLSEILKQAHNLFHHEASNIMLLDGDLLRIAHWEGYELLGGEEIISTLVQPVNRFAVDREMIASRKPSVVRDTYQDTRWVVVPETSWIHSNLSAPIIYRDRLLGQLRLDSSQTNYFSSRDAQRLEPLTHAAAVALANAQLYEQAQREITERKRAEEETHLLNHQLEQRVKERTAELEAANIRLQQLDRLKSQFVADVSHELRTPLTVLSLKLELLERKPDKLDEHLSVLQKQVDQLTTLVGDILDISRLELGHDKVNFTEVDLNALTEQIVAAHSERAESAGLTLHLTTSVRVPLVRGERNQLAQVITNLLSNAIKYTVEGTIEVRTGHDAEQQQAYVEVTDSGMGISAEDLPHLFERFFRGKPTGSLGIPGTGLGLSIIKEIVDIHGGHIDIQSKLEQGSTFKVWLPYAS